MRRPFEAGRFRRLCGIWALGLASIASLYAEEMAPAEPSSQQQNLEIRRKFAELSRKVNELPDLKKLKAEVEKAQEAYTAAFEAAMAKEDPEILAKYRGLFESRIQRMHARRQPSSQTPVNGAESATSDADRRRLADAQQKAMAMPAVREALQKWNSAKSDSERETAKTEYLEILRKTMVETDPSLKPMLLGTAVQDEATPSASAAK